ncbi:hypothetical protein [Halobaculum sp. EA56]|uniref:hypothetical protein n=1 Tax=Halobaculum sp. EA56 TaxID=3421648 RepID=UPI003EBA929B
MTVKDDILVLPDNQTERGSVSQATVNKDDFVESGGAFDPDYDALELHVNRFVAHITAAGQYYRVDAEARANDDTVSLTDAAVNEIYYDIDNSGSVTTGSVTATTGSAPSAPALKIGEVDTSADSYDDTLNRRPDSAFGRATADVMDADKLLPTVAKQLKPDPSASDGITNEYVTIPDDGAKIIDSESQCLVLIGGPSESSGGGLLATSFSTLTTLATTNVSNEGNTTLDGTSGPDGSLNLAIDSNNLYLENRTGSERSYTVVQIGQ